jgi:zeaxanthin glucosyltransferase
MGKLGFFSDHLTGHLNPMLALGSTIRSRGHHVIFFTIADTKEAVMTAGLDFCQIGSEDFPPGSVREINQRMRKWKGVAAQREFIKDYQRQSRMILRDGPRLVRESKLDGLVIDQNQLGAGTVAQHVGVPFIHIVTGCPSNRNEAVPPFLSSRPYRSGFVRRIQNRLEYALINRIFRPALDPINVQRGLWKLPPFACQDDSFSKLAQITQLPEVLEYPQRISLPYFYYAGPFLNRSSRRPTDFPWEQLSDRPLIYASLGTIMHHLPDVSKLFPMIVEACSALDVQLVLSLGGATDSGGVSLTNGRDPKGAPIVVSYAPQLDLLPKSALMITHAGLNSTLEALVHGVPLVALPIGVDQNGVAARLQWSNAGIVVPAYKRSATEIRKAVRTVFEDSHYKTAAQRLQTEINKIQGLERAADLVEKIFNIAPNHKLRSRQTTVCRSQRL